MQQPLTDKACQPLPERVVPAFKVRRQIVLFTAGRVLHTGDDLLIGSQKSLKQCAPW